LGAAASSTAAPFHRLGVEHALGSCAPFHEPDGRRDMLGYALEANASTEELISALVTGRAPEFHHHADGYPTFTDWPNSLEAGDPPDHVLPLAGARLAGGAASVRTTCHRELGAL
jgi:hypothetical protein